MATLRSAFFQADGIDDSLALQAFQAGFDHAPFRAIHQNGHARDIGFGSQGIQESGHALFRIQHGFVHVHIDHLRAAFHLLARHRERFFVVAFADQLRETRRTSHVGSLADVDEIGVRANHQRFEAAEPRVGLDFWRHSWRDSSDRFADGADMLRRRTATASRDIQPAIAREFSQISSHALRRLIETAKRVRQAGIRIASDRNGRKARKFFQKWAHLFCAQSAVHPHAEERHVRDGNPEGLDRLPRKRSAAAIDDRHRHNHRNAQPRAVEIFLDSKKRRFGVERIENRLHEQKVNAALDQSFGLSSVSLAQLIKSDGPRRGIRDVVRDRGRFRGRSHGAGHEASALRMRGHVALHGLPRDLCSGKIHIGDASFERIFRHGHRVGVERIRFDDVGARFQILLMDLPDDLRLGQIQGVIIQAQILAMPREFLTAIARLIQFARLDHRAHGAIEQQDAFAQERIQFVTDLFAAAHRFGNTSIRRAAPRLPHPLPAGTYNGLLLLDV